MISIVKVQITAPTITELRRIMYDEKVNLYVYSYGEKCLVAL